ncbi:MAG: DUF445 family protein [Synergistetes bacterium]|nr:DUF445 family protein [Synergistota bacterium]
MKYVFLPFVAAFVGWITNVIAIHLLFKPYDPVRIPFFRVEIQGVLPKRRKAIAKALGKVVEEELLSKDDIWAELESKEVEDILVHRVLSLLERRMTSVYPSWIPERWLNQLSYFVRGWIEKEIRKAVPEIRKEIKGEILERLSVKELVESKVNSFDLKELETVVRRVASRELRFVEIAGGALGFFVGLLQILLLKILG